MFPLETWAEAVLQPLNMDLIQWWEDMAILESVIQIIKAESFPNK